MPLRDGKTGPAIRSADDVKPGETLVIRPMEGLVTATVENCD